MTAIIHSSNKDISQDHIFKIKLRSGASIVRVRPLFTYDSKYIIVASGTDIKVFSIASGECTQNLRKHKAQIVSLQQNRKNHLQIFSCSEDGIVIRWDISEGQALKAYDIKINPVSAFYVPKASTAWFVTTKIENTDHYRLYSIELKSKKLTNKKMVLKPVLPWENTIAFGVECKFVAAVYGPELHLYNLQNKSYKAHKTGEHNLICVACHPTEFVTATGDNQGRVLVWANIFGSHPTKSIYHWHSLPVSDLTFSCEGSYLYSGGGEAALVKWNLNSENRHILPRLGLPIFRLIVSPENDYIATAHDDNALQLINSQLKVVQIIQGLTQGHFQGSGNRNALSTGMLYDSRSESLIMNGRPGHLQFYKIYEDRQLFNLDIVGRNFISQERDVVIVNTDVQKAAIDDQGQWLATVEYWSDDDISPEIRLKFWKFNSTKQTFVLNTYVFLPHNKEVNYVGFQPFCENVDYLPLAVTTSQDGKFKLWSLNYDNNSDKKESWTCESMGYYRNLPAGDGCFSEDGSLLAVAFGHVATLWMPDSMALKTRFCQPNSDAPLQQVTFGCNSCRHFLVCHNGSMITVWNVLTLSVQLTIKCEVQFLTPDRKSDIIAAFCENQNLFIFKPSNPEPIHFMKNTSSKSIIAAIFIPNSKLPTENQLSSKDWYKKSQLFFLNKDQNLLTITDECDPDQEDDSFPKLKVERNIPVTPFGMLQAEHSKSDVKTDKTKQHIINPQENEKILDVLCPTNQSPIALCSVILPSLLIPAIKKDTDTLHLNNEDNNNVVSGVQEPMDIDNNATVAQKSKFPENFVGITDFSFLRETVNFSRKK